MNRRRGNQRKRSWIAAGLLLVILAFGFIKIYPQLYRNLINASKEQIHDAKEAARRASGDETDESGLIKHARKEDYTEEDLQHNREIQEGIRKELQEKENAYDSYKELYQDALKAQEKAEPGSTRERLANIDQLLEEAMANPSESCTIGTPFTGEATYRVTDVSFTTERRMDAGDIGQGVQNREHIIFSEDGTITAEQGYLLAFVEIEISNSADETSKQIPVHQFEYWLADEEHTLYATPFIWGSLQPGVDQRRYFIPELAPHAAEYTTVLFAVPADDGFSEYSPYLCINMGSSSYNLEACRLIPLEGFLQNEKNNTADPS